MIRFSSRGTAATPLDIGPTVKVYVCGVTPYDAAHLGHVATFLTYDVLVRRLRDLGHTVRYVRNITDLDDPILPKAQQLGAAYDDLVESEIDQFHRDMDELGMLRPDAEPRVSDNIPELLGFIGELDRDGFTYRRDGTIYFDTSRSDVFGSLSGYDVDLRHHLARERGGAPDDPRKRNPLDFVLWRPSRPGEPSLDGPYGDGMPGWHIGCSAMARKLLGETVDVHGGGIDLVFPHHECEQAQTLALQQAPFVNRWHHCEFVRYQGAKMSKSLANTVLARDLLTRHDPRAIRLAIMRLYRPSAGFEWRDRDIVQGERLLDVLTAASRGDAGPDPTPWAERVRAAIDDDLDFPSAVAELEDLARAILSGGPDKSAPGVLAELGRHLGIDPTAETQARGVGST